MIKLSKDYGRIVINDISSKIWRLGPWDDPGWFDISDSAKLETKFVTITAFRLDWIDFDPQQAGIFNRLHNVTIGSQIRKSKIHIENIAQIIQGDLHITSRFCDHAGVIHRNTQPLPGNPRDYLRRWMTLCYTGSFAKSTLTTCSVLYDQHSQERVQCNRYQQHCTEGDVEILPYTKDHVVCHHEMQHTPCDHVNVEGGTSLCTRSFSLQRVWGCLGQTFDPTTAANVAAILQTSWPETIDGAMAWYYSDVSQRCETDQTYAICHGRYQHNQHLGLRLPASQTISNSFF